MSEKFNVSIRESSPTSNNLSAGDKLDPAIQFSQKTDKKTGEKGPLEIKLSDGTPVNSETYSKFSKALKRATGTDDYHYGNSILSHIANGMQGDDLWVKMTRASTMLSVFKPQDETEAILLGQFLSLQEAGMKYIRLAGLQDSFYHLERYSVLANKLFNTANQTMQTLVKYRSKGQQVIQVVHLHNEGQAIVAQNLSHSSAGEGMQKKNEN